MDKTVIRVASEQDIDGLIHLYAELHTFHVIGVPDRLRESAKPDDGTVIRNNLREILRRKDARIYVADREGQLIGLVEAYLHQEESHPLRVAHRYVHVLGLVVSAAYRKSGLGKQLMAAAHQWAKDQEATEVQLEVWEFAEGPLAFYETLGYHTLKRTLVATLDEK